MSVVTPETIEAAALREYRMTVQIGDIVRTPWGILGIVKSWDILEGPAKEVVVLPFNVFLQLLTLGCGFRYYDNQINTLTPLHKAERDC